MQPPCVVIAAQLSVPVRLVWREVPLLEPGAPAVWGEPKHPQVTPRPAPGGAVLDEDADDRRIRVHRHEIAGHRELLVRTVALASQNRAISSGPSMGAAQGEGKYEAAGNPP